VPFAVGLQSAARSPVVVRPPVVGRLSFVLDSASAPFAVAPNVNTLSTRNVIMSLYHTFDALNDRTQEQLSAMLEDDERFMLAVTVSDGLYKRHRSRLVLTDARLLKIKHGYGIHVETEGHPLDDLADVSLIEGGRPLLRVTSPDGDRSYPIEPDDAAEFADALERGVTWHAEKS
jgi:hypothetical protein